jgi:hypothetical protein
MSVMNTFLADQVQDGGKFTMKEHQVLFPIPFSEIDRYQNEDVLWQNPGY